MTALIGALAAAMLSMASAPAGAQAYAVAAGGQGQSQPQSQPMVTIAAENQASQQQLAKLFDAMRIKEQMQSMRQMVPAMFEQQIQAAMKQTEADLPAGTHLTARQREQMQQVMSKYVGKSLDLYPADEMVNDMTGIYQKHLSRDDVEGLTAFYNSAPGQHLLDAQPVIAQEFMPMVMSKVTERSQSLTKAMLAEMAAIKPARPAAARPPAKAPARKAAQP